MALASRYHEDLPSPSAADPAYPGQVPEDPKPPVAVRITRPQASEEEFLEQELDTLSRTGVILLGSQARPQGVVLRFELALTSGALLMRGEGRVVGYRDDAHAGLGGLVLRFTRLDTRSKALVDRATALREQRRAPHPAEPSGPVSGPISGPASTAASLPISGSEPRAARAPVPATPDRDALLDRLRARARGLDAGVVQQILAKRRA